LREVAQRDDPLLGSLEPIGFDDRRGRLSA
jgi:hypothetical protein